MTLTVSVADSGRQTSSTVTGSGCKDDSSGPEYDLVTNTRLADVCSAAVMVLWTRFTLSMKNWLKWSRMLPPAL